MLRSPHDYNVGLDTPHCDAGWGADHASGLHDHSITRQLGCKESPEFAFKLERTLHSRAVVASAGFRHRFFVTSHKRERAVSHKV